jgi:hypothetical protein
MASNIPTSSMNMRRYIFAIILAAGSCGLTDNTLAQPKPRKVDELLFGFGTPRSWCPLNVEREENEMKDRLRRYAKRLRRENANSYIIGYSPRVVEWEIYNRSYGDIRSGRAKKRLSEYFPYKRITAVDGGFRENAVTELWIVPRGASPPTPAPTVKPQDVAHCPFLRVSGQPYVPKPSVPLEFKARLESNDSSIKPVFAWQVSQGRILSGQGTDTISVEVPRNASGKLVTNVTANGYSLECSIDTTTATAETLVGVAYFKFDEYGDICEEDEMARLDNFAIQLQANPDFVGYVVFYGGRCYSSCRYDYPRHRPRYPRRGEAQARADRIKPYLVSTRGIETDRIVVLNGGFRESWTAELWIVPKGPPPPPLTPTVKASDIEYRSGTPTKREFAFGCMGAKP